MQTQCALHRDGLAMLYLARTHYVRGDAPSLAVLVLVRGALVRRYLLAYFTYLPEKGSGISSLGILQYSGVHQIRYLTTFVLPNTSHYIHSMRAQKWAEVGRTRTTPRPGATA